MKFLTYNGFSYFNDQYNLGWPDTEDSFNGKVSIHCAIEAAKNNNDIENQKLLELYAQRKKIPNNFYELYLPLQSINQEPKSSYQVHHDYGASFSLDYLGL